jgi:S-DNA-T family DNA segregation ATPase FtsK/SpoIIIE
MLSDPLAGVVVRNPDALGAAAVTPAGPPVMVLVVGVTEKALSWLMNFRLTPHWLIVGATRSGKSTLIHAIVTRFAPQGVALVAIDLKGGLELNVYRPRLSGMATTRQEAVELLEALRNLIDDRTHLCNVAGLRSVWELEDPPAPIVLVIDEVAELFLITNSRDRDEVALRDKTVTLLVKLAQLGAALDIHVIAGGQRFGSDLGQGATLLRSQLTGRVCMHVADGGTAEMTLGDIWPEAVVAAQMIRPDEQGIAITADSEGSSWVRARAMFTSVDEAAEAAREFSRITPILAGIRRPLFGGVVEDAEGGEG